MRAKIALTRRLNFKGENGFKSDDYGWIYYKTNPITDALNNQMNLTSLVLSSASGTYTYNTTFIITQTFLFVKSFPEITYKIVFFVRPLHYRV